MADAKEVKRRRGTAAEVSQFVGAPAELIVDITNNKLYLHDGTTVGGHVIAMGKDMVSLQETVDELSSATINIQNIIEAGVDEALASHITELDAEIYHPTTGLSASHARIINEMSVRANADEALALDISTLESTLSDVNGLVLGHASAIEDLETLVTNIDGTVTSLSSKVTSLESQVNDPTSGLANSHARITTEITARTTADQSLAQSITTLNSSISNVNNELLGQASAINTLETNVELIDGKLTANASNISTLNTTVGNHSTTITELSESINGLSGTWGVSIDSNNHITALKLIGTETTSEFIIDADVIINGSLTTNKIQQGAIGNFEQIVFPDYQGNPKFDVTNICSYTPTAYANGKFLVIFSCYINATLDADTFVKIRLITGENVSAPVEISNWAGIRVSDGNAVFIIPFSISAATTIVGNKSIRVNAYTSNYTLTQNGSKPVGILRPTLTIYGLKI